MSSGRVFVLGLVPIKSFAARGCLYQWLMGNGASTLPFCAMWLDGRFIKTSGSTGPPLQAAFGLVRLVRLDSRDFFDFDDLHQAYPDAPGFKSRPSPVRLLFLIGLPVYPCGVCLVVPPDRFGPIVHESLYMGGVFKAIVLLQSELCPRLRLTSVLLLPC